MDTSSPSPHRYLLFLLFTLIVSIVSAQHVHQDPDLLPKHPPVQHFTPQKPSGPPPPRVIAIGDFHGDLPNTLRVLRMAKLIDDSSNWIAKPNTILVQTGDIVDRGDATIPLYELMRNLTDQAAAAGSKVVRTLGNHEVMNMAMDWRYVTPGDVKSFGGAKQRQVAFSKDGWIGKELRALPVVALEEGTVFVHGGVTMKWAEKGIQGINDAAKKAMDKGDWYADVFGGEGVLWYRGYAMEHEGEVCGKLVKALYELKAKRMVMGHTPQLNGRILSRCNHMALIVDVGISSYYGGNCAALEIVGDRVTALYCDGEPQDLTPSKRPLYPMGGGGHKIMGGVHKEEL